MGAKPFYRRRFLNRRGHHAGAYVLAECKVEKYPKRSEIEAYVTIADCSRQVTLDFGCATKAEISNALRKAALLRDVFADVAWEIEQRVDELRV
jgi:hypothetical protein